MNSLSRMRERARVRVGNYTKTPLPINEARELLDFYFLWTAMCISRDPDC